MNTIEAYSDAECLEAFLTRDFSMIGNEYIDDIITTLKEYAFAFATGLTTVSLPNITVIPHGAFYGCEVSTTFTITWSKITSIGNCAFYQSSCLKDTSLTLTNCEEIDYGAFAGLNNLVSVTAPALRLVYQGTGPLQTSPGIFEGSSIQSFSAAIINSAALGSNCFKNCRSLTSVSLPEQTYAGVSMFQGCTSLVTLSLPKLATITANNVFQGCTALTSVSLPLLTSLTGISCFYNCTSLASISLPELTGTIASSTFMSCSSLTSFSAPKLTDLGTTVFYGCTSLTFENLNIPNVTTIGSNAFFQCTGLTEFSHDKVTTLQSQAFTYCSNMLTVDLPVCNSIGNSAFMSCTKMTTCKIGGAISSIGDTTFQRCSALESLVLSGISAVPSCSTTAFQNATKILDGTGTIYVPTSLVSSFQTHSVWGQYTIDSVENFVDPT